MSRPSVKWVTFGASAILAWVLCDFRFFLWDLEWSTLDSVAFAGQAQTPDLVVQSVSNPPANAVAGSGFDVMDTTKNSGNATAGASTTQFRLSTDSSITTSDPLVGSRAISSLASNDISTATTSVTIPTSLTPGTYWLGACADAGGVVAESVETNNCKVSTTSVVISAAPSITNLSPNSGSAGTPVTITGANFGANQGTSTITFNGVIATPTNWSSASITAPVPSGATSGPVVVTVGGSPSNGVNFSISGITYVYDSLSRLRAVSDPASDTAIYNYDAVGNLLSISRQSSGLTSVIEFSTETGQPGTPITIYGTGFSTTPSQNTVTFNGVPATIISSTPTQIITTVPNGATTGPIAVTTPAGTATSGESFTIASNFPFISSFSPVIAQQSAIGSITNFTINGDNFDPIFANHRIRFNDRLFPVWVTAGSTTSLTTTIPIGATSGRITVNTPTGTAVSSSDLFLTPSPYKANRVQSSTRVAIGQSLTVDFSDPDKISLVLFDATAGQTVTLNVTNVTVSPRVWVQAYNPDGSTLTSRVVTGSGATIGPLALTQSGSYQILIAARLVSTIAGDGSIGFGGDNGPATSASLYYPNGVAYDSQGNLFIADRYNYRIRKVNTSGTITTIAGTGTAGFSGDGGKAVKAKISESVGVAVDTQGNVFVADLTNYRIRKITPTGLISTVAGNGISDYNGDGIPATSASLSWPTNVTLDSSGNLFIADDNRVRKVNTSGIISTVAGGAPCCNYNDGIPATSATLDSVDSVAVDSQGNLYLSAKGNARVRKVDVNGIISTIAGTGAPGSNFEDYIPATSANLSSPYGVMKDNQGNLYVYDDSIRRIDTNGIIFTTAGIRNASSFNGDNIPALKAVLGDASRITLNPQGEIVFSSGSHYRVRKLDNTTPGSLTLTLTTP